MIKYGVKLWSTNDPSLFHEVKYYINEGIVNFIELYIIPNSLNTFNFALLEGIPTAIHCAHEKQGFNLMKENDLNLPIFQEAQHFANKCNSDVIVVHPGIGIRRENLINNLKIIGDKRLYIENMPYLATNDFGNKKCYGYSYEQLHFITKNNYHLCLDISHSIKASIGLKEPYFSIFDDLLKYMPDYLHICDGSLSNPYDEHLNLGEGEFDLKHILNKIPKDCRVVFEVPKVNETLQNDIKNIQYFKKIYEKI